jgi:hypothetical protein
MYYADAPGPSKRSKVRNALKRRRILDSDDDDGPADPIEGSDGDDAAAAAMPSRRQAAAGRALGTPPGSGGALVGRAALPPALAQAHAIAAAKGTPQRFKWDVDDVALLLKGMLEYGRMLLKNTCSMAGICACVSNTSTSSHCVRLNPGPPI